MNQQSGGFGDSVPEPRVLFYILSFLIPIAGIIIGALYMGKPDTEVKKFGKTCLMIAMIPIILIVLMICCYALIYVVFIVGYIGFLGALIGLGGSSYSTMVPALGAVLLL